MVRYSTLTKKYGHPVQWETLDVEERNKASFDQRVLNILDNGWAYVGDVMTVDVAERWVFTKQIDAKYKGERVIGFS